MWNIRERINFLFVEIVISGDLCRPDGTLNRLRYTCHVLYGSASIKWEWNGDKGKCKNRSQLHIRTNNETLFFSSFFLRMKTSCYIGIIINISGIGDRIKLFLSLLLLFLLFWLMFLHSLTFIAKKERKKDGNQFPS